MLKRYQIHLGESGRVPAHLAYSLYGFLCQEFPEPLVESWHQSPKPPLRQFLTYDKTTHTSTWHVHLIGQETVAAASPLLDSLSEIRLHNQPPYPITKKESFSHPSARDFAAEYLVQAKGHRLMTFHFLTPTAFKSDGDYQNMPTVPLIYKSLIQSWQAYSQEIDLSDQETLQALCQYTILQRYKLSSTLYHLKNTKVPSFTGQVTFYHHGPQPLLALANLLWAFSAYAGIGVKTTLGMGGVATSVPSSPKKPKESPEKA